MNAGPWPVELRLKRAEKLLEIDFDTGERYALPAEYLRVESPSAEVKGHGGAQRIVVGGKRDVGIARIEPVGNYAIRIHFDDGHDTGLYSWTLLHRLGRDRDRIWADYQAALAAKGLTRG